MAVRKYSIRCKITLLVLTITGVVLLLACMAMFLFQAWSIRKGLTRELGGVADMVSSNVVVAAMFDDPERAAQTLSGLEAMPHVVEAVVVRKDGSVLARYAADSVVPQAGADGIFLVPAGDLPATGLLQQGNRVVMASALVREGEQFGMLYLRADFSRTYRDLLWLYAGILTMVLVVSLAVTFVLTRNFQSAVTAPLLQLANTAQNVADRSDYTVRADAGGTDEVQALTAAFNRMLSQIETQDHELQLAHVELQQRLEDLEVEVVDRKRAQAEQERLVSILDGTPDLVSYADASGRVEYMNPAGLRMSGLPEDVDIRGEIIPNFHSREAMEILQSVAMPAAVQHGSWQGELELLSRDGTVVPVSQVLICHRNAEGEVISFSTVMRDITARCMAEEALRQSQEQLLQSSRMAGMAEVATSVLHNVGNVLNSVNVSGNLLNERIRVSRIAALGMLADLVGQHRADFGKFVSEDPRGQRIPELVTAVAAALKAEHAEMLEEVGSIAGHIGHIKEIVAMQQGYARFGGVSQRLPADAVMEDAIRMHEDSLARHGIELVKHYECAPVLLLDKHKVLQILVNLLANARQAVGEKSGLRRITVTIREEAGMVQWIVEDTGCGIAPENLSQIFSHGFTTKKDGHGFGLHSGALAAVEMGGRLLVHSDGPCLGAVFTLELPLSESPALALSN